MIDRSNSKNIELSRENDDLLVTVCGKLREFATETKSSPNEQNIGEKGEEEDTRARTRTLIGKERERERERDRSRPRITDSI